MNNDNFFDMVIRATINTPPVSTGEDYIPEGIKGAAWMELELLKEAYWKNRQIIVFNYK